ncbi:MAG TPA: glycogen-binding domain-containing protein [Nitrospirota bacterium]|nr:glycogen-binding domain-containing protein [Nitrospirota bacterium]
MAVSEIVKRLNESITKGRANSRFVDITFYAPDAKTVYIAGDFNGWRTKAHLIKKGPDGIWRLSIKLCVGRHEYKFYVDGALAQQLPCSTTTSNSYGTYNCVIGVT